MSEELNLLYFPMALALGALHALEPGHAKSLTASYLIGIKGTKRDAFVLGLSVAATHSIIVIGISAMALWFNDEAFAGQATEWLAKSSGFIAIGIGTWMLWKRVSNRFRSSHVHHNHENDEEHHHHDHLDDVAHARVHADALPRYATRGERPSLLQIVVFGAAGGMIPCPASITVMLLALSTGKTGLGLFTVLGFSLGLALSLVSIGLLIVTGLSKLSNSGKLSWLSRHAPIVSAALVIVSGLFALVAVP